MHLFLWLYGGLLYNTYMLYCMLNYSFIADYHCMCHTACWYHKWLNYCENPPTATHKLYSENGESATIHSVSKAIKYNYNENIVKIVISNCTVATSKRENHMAICFIASEVCKCNTIRLTCTQKLCVAVDFHRGSCC